MPAEPERGVAVPGPVELDLAGVLEDGRIPVGGREREQQPVALLERVAVGRRRNRILTGSSQALNPGPASIATHAL
jgi:hypothetical protein